MHRAAAAWSNLGIGLEELGRTAEAEAAYRRAGEVDANDWRALFILGILLRTSTRYGEARQPVGQIDRALQQPHIPGTELQV